MMDLCILRLLRVWIQYHIGPSSAAMDYIVLFYFLYVKALIPKVGGKIIVI